MRKHLTIAVILLLVFGGAPMTAAKKAPPRDLPNFDALWNYGDPAGTEAKFRELLPTAEDSGDVSYQAQLLTQLARAEGLQRKFDDAHRTLDRAEALLAKSTPATKIRYLLERGRVFNSSGTPDKARPLFLQAWDLGLESGEDFLAIDAAHMMGIVEPPKEQLGWSLKALELAEKSEDQRAAGWLGSLYNNIGWTYHDLKDYEKALELFQKALEWRKQIKDESGIRIARWTIGRTYRSMGKLDQALEIQQALEQECKDQGLPQDGYNLEELAECYLLKGETEKAKRYFGKAHRVLSEDQWLAANEPERLKRIKELSQ